MHDGIPRVKIKIGESGGTGDDRDLERIRLARDVIGADVELYVDANGGYSRQAGRPGHASAAAELDVSWFEEPVTSDDLAGLREVAAPVGADVAAGEYGYDLTYFRRMCARRRRRLPAGRRHPLRRLSPSGCASPPSPPRTA